MNRILYFIKYLVLNHCPKCGSKDTVNATKENHKIYIFQMGDTFICKACNYTC